MCPDFTSLSFCQIKPRIFPLVFLFLKFLYSLSLSRPDGVRPWTFRPLVTFPPFAEALLAPSPLLSIEGPRMPQGSEPKDVTCLLHPQVPHLAFQRNATLGTAKLANHWLPGVAWWSEIVYSSTFYSSLWALVFFLTQIASGLFLITCLILIPSTSITHTYGLTPVCQRHSATGHDVIHTPDEQNRWPLRHFHLVDKTGVSQTTNPKNNVRL